MAWLLAAPLLVLLLGLAALFPYGSFRQAARNVRASGHPSTHRARRELRYAWTFFRAAVVAPLLVLAVLQAGLVAIHTFAVPNDTTLSDVFGVYHPEVALNAPDLEAWSEAIEANRRDRAYVVWQQAQGLLPAPALLLAAVLVDHWPIHLAFLLVALGFLTWYFRQPYLVTARTYHRGVVRRAKRPPRIRPEVTPHRRGC